MPGKRTEYQHDGIDRRHNDDAARALLRPDDAAQQAGHLLPAVDPATGEVTGTGSGTGGGNPGEDYDTDHTAGSNTAK